MNIKRILLGTFVFFLILASLSLAAPPFVEPDRINEGYIIQYVPFETIRVNESYKFRFNVYNYTSGQPIVSGITCYMNLYDYNGSLLYNHSNSVPSERFDYSFVIDGNNFSSPNILSYSLVCNNSNLGGVLTKTIPVTISGYQGETAEAIHQVGVVLLQIILIFLTCIIFIVIGKCIEANNLIALALKLLMFCIAMLFLYFPVFSLIPLMEVSIQTLPNSILVHDLVPIAKGTMDTMIMSIRYAIWIFSIFALIYVIYLALEELKGLVLKNNRKEKGM